MSCDPEAEIPKPVTFRTLWPKRPTRIKRAKVALRPTNFLPLANKLINWLEATTSYDTELKENISRKPNHDRPRTKWRLFYSYGPVLVSDNSSVLSADGQPTGFKLALKHISYNQGVQPGEIIASGNGRKYIVQPNGSIRKII